MAPPPRHKPPCVSDEASIEIEAQTSKQGVIGEMLVGAVNRVRQRDRFTLREAIFPEQRDVVAHIGSQTTFRLIGGLPVATTQRSDCSPDVLKSEAYANIRRECGLGQEVI